MTSISDANPKNLLKFWISKIFHFDYFWRTTTRQEIDFVEESDGEFSIFEIKWNPAKGSVKFPQSFMDAYKPKEAVVVTPENYLEYLL